LEKTKGVGHLRCFFDQIISILIPCCYFHGTTASFAGLVERENSIAICTAMAFRDAHHAFSIGRELHPTLTFMIELSVLCLL
jgi:hypothetical protein